LREARNGIDASLVSVLVLTIVALAYLCRDLQVAHMRQHNAASMASKTFEFHIYLTSAPKNVQPVSVVVEDEVGFWGPPREASKLDKVRGGWSELDLYKLMKCPKGHQQLGDVHIWEGRPKWGERFQQVHNKHPKQHIGVTFCGSVSVQLLEPARIVIDLVRAP
jgi:hypothetical protein